MEILFVLMAVCYFALFAVAGLAFVGQIMLGVSINRDAQALGLGFGKAFMILTIFFGGIPAGIYLIVRANKLPDVSIADFALSSKFAKRSIVFTIVGTLLTFIVCFGMMAVSLAVMSSVAMY